MAKSGNRPSKTKTNPMDRYRVPSLERALSILEFLAARASPCGTSEIAKSLGLSKNSVFRTLVSLSARGYVDRVELGKNCKTFFLTGKLLALGYAVIDEASLVEKAIDLMRQLRDQTRETVLLGTLIDSHGTVLEQVPSTEPVKFLINVGHQFPLHTAAPGKAILAFLPEDEREPILQAMPFTRFNDRTITDREQFRQELAQVRLDGYAVDRGEEVDGLRCIAAPVFDHRGRPLASLWVTGPSFRLLTENFPQVARHVMDQAKILSCRLGYAKDETIEPCPDEAD